MKQSPNRSSLLIFIVTILPIANAFQIAPLLSTIVDACQRGCHEIRTVQASRELSKSSGNADSLQVTLKDEQDPRSALTEADAAAHKAIVGSLRAEWGEELYIVGEEDDDEALASSLLQMSFPPLKRDMFDDDIGETVDIDPKDITIFVDPLDGTREFVEGRLENCQVLVGIAINGEAVAGAIGIPFPTGDLTSNSTIVYGLAEMGSGVIGEPLARGPFPLERNIDGVKYPRPHHATGDSADTVMTACRNRAVQCFGGSTVLYGGAGNKILAASLGEVACSIQHKVGGAWDLCAPEAVLKAMGGKMTDLFGEEIEIYGRDAPRRCNERGYLVTPPGREEFHQYLVDAIKVVPEVQAYRKEIQK